MPTANREISWRTDAVDNFRYLGLEVLGRCCVSIVPNNDTEIGVDTMPALTA